MGNTCCCKRCRQKKRDRAIANIESALHVYLSDSNNIKSYIVSDDDKSEDPEIGLMTTKDTRTIVMPDLTATHLVYESTVQIFSRLFLCTDNNSKYTKFLFVWNVEDTAGWQWHIGSPHSSGEVRNGHAIKCSNENITRQVAAGNSIHQIKCSFANMMPGTPFSNDMFDWAKSGVDFKSNGQWYIILECKGERRCCDTD